MADTPEVQHRTLHFSISGDFLSDHIKNLMNEGRIAQAFKLAEGCLGNPELTAQDKIIIAFELMTGAKHLTDSKIDEEPAIVLEDGPNEDVNLAEAITEILTRQAKQIESLKDEKNNLLTKINCIYEACELDHEEALRDAIILYRQQHTDYLFSQDEREQFSISNRDITGRDNPNDTIDAVKQMCEVDQHADRPLYGWLDPKGEFHKVSWGNHETWAYEHIAETDSEEPDFGDGWGKRRPAGDELIARGWVLLHNPVRGVAKATLDKEHKLTVEQKKFLTDYYNQWERPFAVDAINKNWMHELPEIFDLIDTKRKN